MNDAISNVDNFDIKFEKGNEAYGTYVLSGVSEGGMLEAAQSESWTNNTGSFSFDLETNHYVDQVYSYESGGVILEQEERTLMSSSPQIKFSTKERVTIVSIHNFDIHGSEYSIGGSRIIEIELWFISEDTSYQSENPKSKALLIEVSSKRTGAWRKFLVDSLEKAGVTEEREFVVEEEPGILRVAIIGTNNGPDGKDIQLSNLGVTRLGVKLRE